MSQGPQMPMSLMRIDGHSDHLKYQINNKIKATKVKQNWRSSHEIKLKKKIVIGYRDTMTEDRTSAQNAGPQDRTSSSGGSSSYPSPSSTTSLFINIVTSFFQLNICVRRRRSRRMVKIELVLVFRNRWLYIYVVNI